MLEPPWKHELTNWAESEQGVVHPEDRTRILQRIDRTILGDAVAALATPNQRRDVAVRGSGHVPAIPAAVLAGVGDPKAEGLATGQHRHTV